MKRILSILSVIILGLSFQFRAVAGGPGPKGTPNVTIVSPSNLTVAIQGTVITFKATATESGGTITKVEFFANSTKIGEVDNAPYNFNWLYPDTGAYLIQVKATDAVGGNNSAFIYVGVYAFNTIMSGAEGDGLSLNLANNTMNLGDTISGLGAHSFHSNRYQFLNGHQYSFGGSRRDPVNKPVFRLYDNGDWSSGTTMDRAVNTTDSIGMRYNARSNLMQIGASDRIDSTIKTIAYGPWPTSGLIINTDVPNTIKGRLQNTVFASLATTFDTAWRSENTFIGMEAGNFTGPGNHAAIRSWIGGFANTITADIDASVVSIDNTPITKPINISLLGGYNHITKDSTNASLIGGTCHQFGGLGQVLGGIGLINRTPGGAAFGRANVDFATLPYTGFGASVVSNLINYPLLSVGNAENPDGTVSIFGDAPLRSNALTMLYSGRTQINTTGFNRTLSQSDVTPQAALDIVSTNTGVLLPRLTNAQRNAITGADLHNGLLLYNTDSSLFQYYNGSAWTSVGSGAGGSGNRWLPSSVATGTIYDSLDNIAIGTSNPQGYKLAVNGAAIFNVVKVKATNLWPDYVFHNDYILPGLKELEEYIRKHQHLPGIASAKEVEENGIDIGENQKALLKKVEEMTLYVIKQDKQLDEQKARMDTQQKEIDELKAHAYGGVAQDCLSTHVFNDCNGSGYITLGFNAVSGASSGVADPLTIQRSNLAVGINTGNPQARLHITGAGADNTTSSLLVNNHANTEVFRILDNGNIGIGTATPQSTLAVNGNITTKKITATPNGWPDYVFNEGYQLPGMTAVASYIRKNHHLPGIASAAEVEKNGVDLGANQAALLKKVEELTLYLIEEHKELEKLKAENRRLAEDHH